MQPAADKQGSLHTSLEVSPTNIVVVAPGPRHQLTVTPKLYTKIVFKIQK